MRAQQYYRCVVLALAFIIHIGLFGCSQPSEMSNDEKETTSVSSHENQIGDVSEKPSASLVASANSTETEKWVSRRILVQPKKGVNDSEVASVLSGHGAKTISKITALNIHIVELPENANEKAIAALIAHNPKFEFAEVDGMVQPNASANDPYYSSAWHLQKIQAPLAWDVSLGDGVVIGILDSGVDGTHPDLVGKMVAGYNFYDNNTDTTDVHGHGTACAGAAAASSNNGIGVTGVSWNSKIMPLRISDTAGVGYWSMMASGITWAADHGARVVSLSYASMQTSSAVASAAAYMQNKGGCTVIAMSNTGALESTPNNQTEIFVTATSDSNDTFASWSTFGPSADISAPGYGIWTTQRGGTYGSWWGTSFSTPIVAGVVALMMSANPNLPGQQIQSLLYQNADDLGALGWDQYYGHGRVNAVRAVTAAKNAVVQDLINPTVSFSSPTAGAKVSGNINVNVNASDNVGVTKVYVYAAGNLVANLTTAPYTYSLNTLNYADGNLSLMANAYDAAGNIGSTTINVTVANSVDITAPVVNIVSPADGVKVSSSSTTITANATDNIGITSMTIIIDGSVKATSTTGSISYRWNTRKISTGTHTIRVEAKDSAGNTGSKTIQVTK